ncbi:MAG: imidazoleglycerol-phosphate dehydratase HisB [Synergistaceae bacterium]|nr:imidazoleglycerol-phosphate dehydratase HisB [Synergistaceae bacterium]MBQ6418215.1 imidazoleglycerol-phosphate dehydratase HisB [Synergistaceae bacterium]MBQ6665496.1 imidazoleglycerol-phosphate dehydratase HisB [Synergistaceae bacterium]MBQ6981386.1 imidazoleglycerol-phosphate dehydratase HisB [Synergistaceae bacterium]MBR0248559.1 imidazoleglycerol-phosphate dehydratase HisB [Synergistaceae bacterium]
MRTSHITRTTKETDITLSLELDGTGKVEIDTGCGFLNHMLTLFAAHGRFDLSVNCKGDYDVDYHHTTEDVGICLGLAFREALGAKKGINRYGNMILPMDEALVMTAVDFSGRAFLGWEVEIPTQKVGNFDTELAEEFWRAFAGNSLCTLHFRQLSGKNSHHIIECAFKSAARSISQAVRVNPELGDEVPSTKGVI